MGTYDGSHWNLYRNGSSLASVADAVGPLAVNGPEWAVGATGMGWGDFFAGSVDEVAVYGTALSATTVKAHYYVGQNGEVTMTITHSGGTIAVNWPAGTLPVRRFGHRTVVGCPGGKRPDVQSARRAD